jgi:transcriptional regulator with XRE-family HTH domain
MVEPDRELIALGRAIRQLRDERNVTADALAVASGIEPERLSALEAGRFDPHYDLLIAVADALRIEPSVLFLRATDLDRNTVCLAFGRRLRALRAEQSVSQNLLSRRAGTHSTEIGKLERGERDPRLTTILRLARGLDRPPEALVEGLIVRGGDA